MLQEQQMNQTAKILFSENVRLVASHIAVSFSNHKMLEIPGFQTEDSIWAAHMKLKCGITIKIHQSNC